MWFELWFLKKHYNSIRQFINVIIQKKKRKKRNYNTCFFGKGDLDADKIAFISRLKVKLLLQCVREMGDNLLILPLPFTACITSTTDGDGEKKRRAVPTDLPQHALHIS